MSIALLIVCALAGAAIVGLDVMVVLWLVRHEAQERIARMQFNSDLHHEIEERTKIAIQSQADMRELSRTFKDVSVANGKTAAVAEELKQLLCQTLTRLDNPRISEETTDRREEWSGLLALLPPDIQKRERLMDRAYTEAWNKSKIIRSEDLNRLKGLVATHNPGAALGR